MKFWTEKKFVYKIIIAIVFVILFNFMAPTISSASLGGPLFSPIKDLLLVIADGIVQLTHRMLFGMDVSFITIHYEHDWIPSVIGGLAGLLAGAAAIVVGVVGAPFSGGLSLAAVAAGIKIAVGSITIAVGTGLAASYLSSKALPPNLKLPMFAIDPSTIFSNKIALLDVNFFNPNEYDNIENASGESKEQTSSALTLRPTITKWYFALRNFAIVALLSILIYIGIRIIISSSAENRAKYKQRLMDWLVAMCLLFFMHYIMAFATTMVEEIVKAVNTQNDDYGIIIGTSVDVTEDGEKDLKEYQYDDGTKVFSTDSELANRFRDTGIIVPDTDNPSTELFIWPSNLMGKARIELQLEPQNITEDDIAMRQFGYTVIYLALVMYTILFLFRYLKRLLMMTFLTIIAPLMAMTYPLDKMHDGSAQGFSTWFKEYMYNLLIQPVHLILYTVLIGSAMDMVADNLIYALVALGFILQAEKIMRKLFGFEKASTLAGGSALGGALAMQGINQLGKVLGRSKKSEKGNRGNGSNDRSNQRLNRGHDKGKDTDELMDRMYENGHDETIRAGGDETAEPIETAMTPQQAMLAAYDDNYGTDAWDPQERDAMAREHNQQADMGYSAEEYANILRDSGYGDDEIDSMGREAYGDSSHDEPTSRPILMPEPMQGQGTMPRSRTTRASAPRQGSMPRSRTIPEPAPRQGSMPSSRTTPEPAPRQRSIPMQEPELGQGSMPMQELELGQGTMPMQEPMQGQGTTPRQRSIPMQEPELGQRSTPGQGSIPMQEPMREQGSTSVRRTKSQRAKDIFRGVAVVTGKGMKYAGPKMARMALKGLGAATAGTIGVAAGLVSDDFSNVFKYGAAGAGAGWIAGSGVSSMAQNMTSIPSRLGNTVENIGSTYNVAANGAEAEKARQQAKMDAQFIKDRELRRKYQEKLGLSSAKEAKEAMKEAITYRQYGITDNDIIIGAMKAEGFGKQRNSDDRIMLAQVASQVNGSKKELQEIEKSMKKRGIPESNINKYSNAVRTMNNWI